MEIAEKMYGNMYVAEFEPLNEINVTRCDRFVDVAQGLGEPRTFGVFLFYV